jgi:Ulp1 family protease
MQLVMRQVPHLHIQPTSLSSWPEELRYSENDTIFIHHIEEQHHFLMSTSIGGTVQTFDSLNLRPSPMLKRQIEAIYQPRSANSRRQMVKHPKVKHKQHGSADCGVFAIAYAVEVAMGTDPKELPSISFQRTAMRVHLEGIFDSQCISRFPRT